ncbi:MAG: cyclodeaminase/cyclohydrolase family protein, partial [Bacteroidia bacterium]|nr:cyclodeaminase/cyclohydrolase family protein [Bacteroidia bacterium]
SESELIHIAIKSLGLSEVSPFDPKKKIIEYALAHNQSKMIDWSVQKFTEVVASESPAPGGGSVAALCGSMGAALGAMVANLSAGKRGWEDKLEEFSAVAVRLQEIRQELLRLVDEDTHAFNQVMAAYALPKSTEAEKKIRTQAIQQANEKAAIVPLQTAKTGLQALPLLKKMVETGNPASVTDAAVGAFCLQTCITGAILNVKINLQSLDDSDLVESLELQVNSIQTEMNQWLNEIVPLAQQKVNSQ